MLTSEYFDFDVSDPYNLYAMIGKNFIHSSFRDAGKNFITNLTSSLGALPSNGFGLGVGFLEGLVGDYFNRKSLDYQAQLNEQSAVNAYNRQLDFWNKQNAYNDPSSQMRRLQQAGLNPAMINANGVNNVAGGLSSVSPASPGSPDHSKPNTSNTVNSVIAFAKSIKEMGFLDEKSKTELEKRLNLIVERGLKEVDKELKIEERDLARLNKIEAFEALYGTSLDGGEPTIKNNRITTSINEARGRISLDEARTAVAEAEESYTKFLEQYQRDKNNREAMLALADEAVKKAMANAYYAQASASSAQANATSAANAREEQRLAMEQEIHTYLMDINASEAEITKTNEWLSELWSKDAQTLMDENTGLYRGDILRARWRDFIHHNLRLGGTAGISHKK